jgi:hypothetical protein
MIAPDSLPSFQFRLRLIRAREMARPHGARGRAVNAVATLMRMIEGASDRGILVIRRAVPRLDNRGDGLRERRRIIE